MSVVKDKCPELLDKSEDIFGEIEHKFLSLLEKRHDVLHEVVQELEKKRVKAGTLQESAQHVIDAMAKFERSLAEDI